MNLVLQRLIGDWKNQEMQGFTDRFGKGGSASKFLKGKKVYQVSIQCPKYRTMGM
jgi:hypothetical protein